MAFGASPHLFCFGLGYSAGRLASRLLKEGWVVSGTCRSDEQRLKMEGAGVHAFVFDGERPLAAAGDILAPVTDILCAVPPDENGDPVLRFFGDGFAGLRALRWIGYLSTTGVYGDSGGDVVDETAPIRPTTARSRRRVAAERSWLDLHERQQLPVHLFRLAGIYGPGRSAFDQVLAGTAKRIDRPGHLFSRIHVDDIATALRSSMARPDPGRIYNVCDDEAASPADVIACACALLGRPPPPLVPFAEAAKDMTPMALSFWHDNRRVDNGRLKRELGVKLRYPNYRAGLEAIVSQLTDNDGTTNA